MTTGRVYAVTIELHEASDDRLVEVRRILERLGFHWQYGGLYFGGATINAVTCVMAAQELGRTLPWFTASARDFRMLRIEENNDLMLAVRQAAGNDA